MAARGKRHEPRAGCDREPRKPANSRIAREVFLLEPRINEMEIVIDEHAVRLLRRGSYSEDELRMIVSALKITNDLERIGDLAVTLRSV